MNELLMPLLKISLVIFMAGNLLDMGLRLDASDALRGGLGLVRRGAVDDGLSDLRHDAVSVASGRTVNRRSTQWRLSPSRLQPTHSISLAIGGDNT